MFGSTGTASAQGTLGNLLTGQAICTGAGQLKATKGFPTATWQLTGQGGCGGYEVNFSGTGTSNGLGFCTNTLLVTNLNIKVNGTIKSPTGTLNFTETWGSPISLFPLATPFLITNSNLVGLGAGVAFHRVSLTCGNTGNQPAANFAWVRL
jgi:hypothetical protein